MTSYTMDQTRTPQSELLQNRLRTHKAETARSRTQSPQEATERRRNLGRDDDIFSDEEPSNRSKQSTAKRTSPAAPSAWRYDREPTKNKPANGATSSSNSTPRALGAREMEDHIDKLSKQNFDLKMEVFHRREKIEQLEKKLADYALLEEDLTNTLDANEELVVALEARDRAVDEAVVMITDLEQKNRDLEMQLDDAKAAAAAARNDSGIETPRSAAKKSTKTPRKPKDRQSLKNSVSPDVSARLVELAKATPESPEEPGPMPSFLKNKEPATAALRSMYVDGDQVVRPLPSRASLLSVENPEDNDPFLAGMKSPGLSELSESDLKSIYNAKQPVDKSQAVEQSQRRPEDISQHASARVSKWVEERAISPSRPNKPRKSGGTVENEDFQSLDHVLKRQTEIPRVQEPIKARARPSLPQKVEKDDHTPPMPINPVFGQNMFPPTPDTMVTRPSNNSTTSFIPDKIPAESNMSVPRDPPAVTTAHHAQPTTVASNPKNAPAPNSFLPSEFDAWDSPPQERRRPPYDATRDYQDDFMPRGYSSDGSFSQGSFPRYGHRNQSSLTGTTAIDAESFREMSAARNSPSPPRFFDTKQNPTDFDYPVLPSRGPGGSARTRDQLQKYSNQATPVGPPYYHNNHSRQMSNTSTMMTPTQAQPLPLSTANGLTGFPKHGLFPSPAAVAMASPPSVKTTKTLAARTASIRDRFLRRKTAPITPVEITEPPKESPPRRSSSITRKFRFRRSSSEHGRVPPLPTGVTYPPSIAGTSTGNTSFYTVNGYSSTTIPSPERAKSERHRPSMSATGQSDRSLFSSSSSRINAPVTPDGYGSATNGNISPGSANHGTLNRRPSSGNRRSSFKGANSSNTDIPPVPNTPTEYRRWDSEPEAGSARSRWGLGSRSRSTSRTRRDPPWTTLAAYDGTAAGQRV